MSIEVLFIVAAACGFSLLAYWHPSKAALLATALLPTYLLRIKIAFIPTNLLEILILILLLNSLRNMGAWRATWQRFPVWYKVGVCIWLIAATASIRLPQPFAITSPDFLHTLSIWKSWILLPVVFALCVVQNRSHKVVKSLIASGTVIACMSFVGIGSQMRLHGIYDVPASLALFLVPISLLALWQKKWIYYSAAAVMWVAIVATQSIGAAVSLAAAMSIGALLYGDARQKKIYLVTTVFIFIIAFGYLQRSGRITYFLQPSQKQATSWAVRQLLWSISLDLISENPMRGVGLGRFEAAYQQKLHQRFIYAQTHGMQLPLPEFVFRDPHNWLLSMWLNTGLLGAVSFTLLQVVAVSRGLIRAKAGGRAYQGLTAALISLLLFGLVDTIYWKNDLAVLQWTLSSVLITHPWPKKPLRIL